MWCRRAGITNDALYIYNPFRMKQSISRSATPARLFSMIMIDSANRFGESVLTLDCYRDSDKYAQEHIVSRPRLGKHGGGENIPKTAISGLVNNDNDNVVQYFDFFWMQPPYVCAEAVAFRIWPVDLKCPAGNLLYKHISPIPYDLDRALDICMR